MRKIISEIILVIIIILLILSTFLFHFRHLLYNENFYDKEYQKNGIYEKFGRDIVWENTYALWDYLQGKAELENEYFSERDTAHMIDVRNLIQKTVLFFYIFGIAFVVLLVVYCILLKKEFLHGLSRMFLYTGISLLVLLLIAFLLSSQFSSIFTQFHYNFFSNELWMMDPAEDSLINLYPQTFFKDFVSKIFINSAICGSSYLILGLVIRQTLKRIRTAKSKR